MAREKRKEKAKLHQLYNLKVSLKKKEKKKKMLEKQPIKMAYLIN